MVQVQAGSSATTNGIEANKVAEEVRGAGGKPLPQLYK